MGAGVGAGVGAHLASLELPSEQLVLLSATWALQSEQLVLPSATWEQQWVWWVQTSVALVLPSVRLARRSPPPSASTAILNFGSSGRYQTV